ncbi:uncharacterized protein [Rutidosis leptorrhynchoides]|uniref:uncharacterized protein n=1 Tax=Rutidosis leptorrhynchoides TaxID=125765 RepID=UPI003A99472A
MFIFSYALNVTLVPKRLDPIPLNDYRPISLIGSYYRIVAKLLLNRLRKVVPKLVGFEQSAFIKGRNILDGALIVNETLDYLKQKRIKSLIFKVDFEKAFDCLSWEFLMEVMDFMGFGVKWRKWILSCLKSASISILVNGSPANEFSLERESPVVLFFALPCPAMCAKKLEIVRRSFLWGVSGNNSKIASVKWESVLLPFWEGGLNLGTLKSKNLALIRKWWWRFKTVPTFLWVKVISSIYGPSGGFDSSNYLHDLSTTWANIVKTGGMVDSLGVDFRNSFYKIIGSGSFTSF